VNLIEFTLISCRQFKCKLITSMVLDFGGCFLIEVITKYLFADLEPKPFVTKGIERRLKRRAEEAAAERARMAGLENGNEKKTA